MYVLRELLCYSDCVVYSARHGIHANTLCYSTSRIIIKRDILMEDKVPCSQSHPSGIGESISRVLGGDKFDGMAKERLKLISFRETSHKD